MSDIISNQLDIKTNSSFPTSIDEFNLKRGFTKENLNDYKYVIDNLKKLKELQGDLTEEQRVNFISYVTQLEDYSISSGDVNKINGAIIKMQEYLINAYKRTIYNASITNSSKTIEIGEAIDDTKTLDVFVNGGIHLVEGASGDYTISDDGTKIVRTSDLTFNAPLTLQFIVTRNKLNKAL